MFIILTTKSTNVIDFVLNNEFISFTCNECRYLTYFYLNIPVKAFSKNYSSLIVSFNYYT